MTDLAKIEVNDYGGAPFATHNMPCSVCRENHAVIELDNGRFQPCWSCQRDGWKTIKVPWWAKKLLNGRGI